MSDNELWSAIIGVLAAVIVRVLDYYVPGIGRVTETHRPVDDPKPGSSTGRHRAEDQDDGSAESNAAG